MKYLFLFIFFSKIGIVGRTGAGKSSILNAVFRLTEPDGSVKIDNIDIKFVDLPELRKRISIIPQVKKKQVLFMIESFCLACYFVCSV